MWKLEVWDDIPTIADKSSSYRKTAENFCKLGHQKAKNSAQRRWKAGIRRRDSDARPSTGAEPRLPSLRECEQEAKKVEQEVEEGEIAQRRSLDSREVHFADELEVGHLGLEIPSFGHKEKCAVTQQRPNVGAVQVKSLAAMQRRAAAQRRASNIAHEPSESTQHSARVRTLLGENISCVKRNVEEELVVGDNKPVVLVILITFLNKLILLNHIFGTKRTTAGVSIENRFRLLCCRLKDLMHHRLLPINFVNNNAKCLHENYSERFTGEASQTEANASTRQDAAPQLECQETSMFPVSSALRPTKPKPLLGLTWCLLLLLSCTGSLVTVRDLHETLNWAQKNEEGLKGSPPSTVPLVGAQAAIIPPAWANITVNPCALESWQLLYWPPHDKCYKIFSRGPCAAGEELYHDPESGDARCRCERGSVRHTGRCHVAYSRGPCRPREYLVEVADGEEAECQAFVRCATGHVFWPQDGLCYRQFTQGPCQHGDLIHLHPESGWPTCGCDSSLMRMQYWHHANTCHELLTRGPCVTGHVFTYNRTARTTECGCGPHLSSNYHRDTAQCYPLDTQGPCPDGHTFSLPTGAAEPMCTCLSGHLLHVGSGTCQRAYTRAVCTSGQFLRPDPSAGVGVGRCAPVPCTNTGHLYHPETDSCYPVGTTGPCAKGKLWVYERASSFRGRCHCDDKLVGYWGPHNICYPLGEKGPCPTRHVVTYSPSKGLACSCDRRRGYTRWKGRCERITAADIIRDLISRNLMAPARDRDSHFSNSVMLSKARSLREETTARLTTRARFLRTTPSVPATPPTTPRPTRATTIEEDTTAPHMSSGARHRVDTHEIVTFSRANSIEETAGAQQNERLEEEADISTRIARLTHRGLITRRARRLPSSPQ